MGFFNEVLYVRLQLDMREIKTIRETSQTIAQLIHSSAEQNKVCCRLPLGQDFTLPDEVQKGQGGINKQTAKKF